MQHRPAKIALRTCVIYGSIAAAWILLSDRVVGAIVADPSTMEQLQTYKGWAFVAITTALLYGVLRREVERWEQENVKRERAEHDLRERERKLSTLFEILPVGISILNADRNISYTNPALAKILDIPTEDLYKRAFASRSYLNAAGEPMPAEGFASVRSVLENRVVEHIETGMVKEDGSVIWTSVSAVPVDFPDWRVVVVTSDITERKRAERHIHRLNAELEQRVADRTAELSRANDHLRELDAFKDNLLTTISHDLRSPLSAIQNMAELLLEEHDLPDEVCRLVQRIYDAARGLTAMLSNMLDLSKLEAGKVELEPIDLRVSAVARQSLEALLANAQAKTIRTELHVEPDEPLVSADPLKLARIINNLLSNAIKFTPPGGQITVTVEPEPSGMCMRVADTGLGIPADALPHLFEKFHQVHTRGTGGERGSGLGLAIVQQLVELHGGTIEVSSAVRRGSTFSVHLPAQAGAITRR